MSHSLFCYISPRKRKGRKVAAAFLEGAGEDVTRYGCPDQLVDALPIFWGVAPETSRFYRAVHSRHWPHIYLDNGYFGRGVYYRATWNKRQFTGACEPDFERLAAHRLRPKKWQKGGTHIVVAVQSELYYKLFLDCTQREWLRRVVKSLRKFTDRTIKVRQKPPPGAYGNPIAGDLQGAHALVTHSSAAAIDALLAGVPVFVLDQECATVRMGYQDLSLIETPYYPENLIDWLGQLAANQWTKEEMRRGEAWEWLKAQA